MVWLDGVCGIFGILVAIIGGVGIGGLGRGVGSLGIGIGGIGDGVGILGVLGVGTSGIGGEFGGLGGHDKHGIWSSQGPLKKVDIYVALGNEEKKELRKTTHAKKKKSIQKYTMHTFDAQYFKIMTNIREWYVDKLLLELFPSFLRQSKLMDHLPAEVLKKKA
ncbi:uncharacterized protein LOC107865376 [Capsicum annuum]|uniref:uncharacterized protein LOC107865376 n=1 Tax=Capsicum annuum TaxID=4072 RepID=UPI001FB096E7|nr:uncharacterized protein LOC107865376 [Capsicum annuum]